MVCGERERAARGASEARAGGQGRAWSRWRAWSGLRLVFGACVAMALLAGCGDSQLTPTQRVGQEGPTTIVDANNNTVDPNNSTTSTNNGTTSPTTTSTNGQTVDQGCCIMIPVGGERQLDTTQYGSVFVGVYLYDRATGSPKTGELIEFELERGDGDAQLEVASTTTNASGQALVRLFAGEQMRDYTLTARHPGADDVEFNVSVGALPSGSLRVSYVNAGESVYAIAPIETFVFRRTEFVCNNFRPQSGLPDNPPYMDEIERTTQVSEFEGLEADQQWTVVSIGYGEFGQIAAAGCMSNVYIQDQQTTEVEMVLTLLQLNPVGRYDVTSNWDFTQTLEDSGNVGQILLEIFSAFENPGRFLLDQILDLIRLFLGEIITSAVDFFLDVFGLDDQIEDGINGFISGNDFLSRIQQAGLDLRDMVTHLEVISRLTIGKVGSDYEIAGSDDWLGLAVYWRWNCDANSPPDCGRIELALDADSSLGLVFGEWRGQVTAYNQLQIYPHAINLHYGRLILYLLNEILLPALTDGNANSMMDAVLYWINCQGLARSITGSDGEICAPLDVFCVQDDDIAGVCESTIRTVFGFAEVLLNDLQVESVIELSGGATLIERDGDLLVDEMMEGYYDGTVNIQGSRSPFEATWSAVRVGTQDDGELGPNP